MAEDEDLLLLNALRSLNLPNPPMSSKDPPTIRILAVADVDLPSASALAEYALREEDSPIGGGRVDLCVACGPFCSDDNLLSNPRYLEGRSRQRMQQKLASTRQYTRALRSREESAALEGLVSAALSQLESIVCRLVFIPGSNDPISIIKPPPNTPPLRLTCNARNIHRQWLQLAPGLGCAGLLDATAVGMADGDDTTDYSETAERLLELAHPTADPKKESQPTDDASSIVFEHAFSQAILLTAPNTTTTDNDDILQVNAGEQDETHKDEDPFPSDFLNFIDSPSAQRQVVVNVSPGDEPHLSQRGNVSMVIPGSLRKKGDFCLINVGLCKTNDLATQSNASRRSYIWRVSRVEFRNMNRSLP